MSNHELRAAVEAHSCWVAGTKYTFDLQWATAEDRHGGAFGRMLVDVHAFAENVSSCAPAATLHLVVLTTGIAELPLLLTDALLYHLQEEQVTHEVEGVPQ